MRLPETDSVSTETKKLEDKGKLASKWWKKINNYQTKISPTNSSRNKRKKDTLHNLL